MKYRILLGINLMLSLSSYAHNNDGTEIISDTIGNSETHHLDEIVVARRRSGMIRMKGAMNGSVIGKEELFKAACCNLGESFTTNPSVDVSYNDATTGAKQIKLLGLSGTYVQMMTENLPNFRGVSAPYALGYVPGPWMKSIQVSKGASSVKNGFEGITGQINVQYLQPDDPEGITLNAFGDIKGRFEANADGNLHITDKLSTTLLGHFENNYGHHDDNGDTFLDKPKVKQYNFQNRWLYKGDRYIFHGGAGLLEEWRNSGQVKKHGNTDQLFEIGLRTSRYEGYMKHAYVIDPSKGTNIALMASGAYHHLNAGYGLKSYQVNEKDLYAQLMFETQLAHDHNLSTGLSIQHDYFGQDYRLVHDSEMPLIQLNEKETTFGGYAQYTYNLHEHFVLMAGLRLDHSSLYGIFMTPRLHLKWQPNEIVGFRASIGKGYRTPHVLAENNYLLSGGRTVTWSNVGQEKAWNYGLSTALNIPLFNKNLKVNAEYYYTDFINQAVVDFDTNPHEIHISGLNGKSYSHTFQVDAQYELFRGFELTTAYRRNIVKTTYYGELRDKPLNSKYKALLTASYKTPLGLWQFDGTLQLNGSGRLPKPYQLPDGSLSWSPTFRAFEQVNVQITRWFRHFSVYVGGENLTNFKQKNPIINPEQPWSDSFDPTMIWGPVHGFNLYAGIRVNIGRL